MRINFEDMTLEQLAVAMVESRNRMDAAKNEESAARAEWDVLRRKFIPEKMEEMGLESARIKDVGRLSVRTDAFCSTPAANKPKLFEWLIENGHSDLITDSVNGSTLKAFIKEQILAGNDVPLDIINYDPYTFVAITKG